MAKRGPTDTDRTTPPADGDVEVVNAAGERKTASLPKRMLAGARDLVSMTDEQGDPALQTWTDELADDPGDQTLVVGNGDVAVPDQAPANTLATWRSQYRANNTRIAEQAHRHTAQRVELDEQARRRVLDISHLFALTAIGNEADAALASDGWAVVPQRLIDAFATEVAGWQQDRGAGS
jgi:hypothetical protein